MSLTFARLSPHAGAEVGGIDLRRPVDDATVQELHAALMRHCVLFFRDQDISPAEQAAFARNFGRLRVAQRAAFELLDGVPEVSVLENDRERPPNIDHYHTDGIYRPEPEFASILRAVTVPDAGGDTIFVSQYAAYDALSDDLKAYLDGKTAMNDFMKLHGSPQKARSWKNNFDGMEKMRRQNPPIEWPLVRSHPVTGRRHLYLSESFTTNIVGLSKGESDGILAMLFRHCAKPEFQCRFKWRPGSVAFWDNRASMHYAVADYWPEHRLMNRLTIETDGLAAGAGAAAAE